MFLRKEKSGSAVGPIRFGHEWGKSDRNGKVSKSGSEELLWVIQGSHEWSGKEFVMKISEEKFMRNNISRGRYVICDEWFYFIYIDWLSRDVYFLFMLGKLKRDIEGDKYPFQVGCLKIFDKNRKKQYHWLLLISFYSALAWRAITLYSSYILAKGSWYGTDL